MPFLYDYIGKMNISVNEGVFVKKGNRFNKLINIRTAAKRGRTYWISTKGHDNIRIDL